jgi:GntR family transcriptional regulator/MocR family aminotransferase
VHHQGMARHFPFTIDRSAKVTLAEQIRRGITDAVDKGLLVPGASLPSWRDLAAQLGVARDTVRTAYESLADASDRSDLSGDGAVLDMAMGPAAPAPLQALGVDVLFEQHGSRTYDFRRGE